MVIDLTNILTNIIESISVIVAAVSVIVGVNAWRREYVGKRNLELAEEVLALFYEARDVISYIRNPFSYVGEGSTRKSDPSESLEDKQFFDRAYIVFERYNKRQELFNKIYSMRYRYSARFGQEAAEPFEELDKIMKEILDAATMLPDYWARQGREVWSSEQEFKEHLNAMQKLERIFWEIRSDDPIKRRVDKVISLIEKQTDIIIKGESIIEKIRKWLNQLNKQGH